MSADSSDDKKVEDLLIVHPEEAVVAYVGDEPHEAPSKIGWLAVEKYVQDRIGGEPSRDYKRDLLLDGGTEIEIKSARYKTAARQRGTVCTRWRQHRILHHRGGQYAICVWRMTKPRLYHILCLHTASAQEIEDGRDFEWEPDEWTNRGDDYKEQRWSWAQTPGLDVAEVEEAAENPPNVCLDDFEEFRA